MFGKEFSINEIIIGIVLIIIIFYGSLYIDITLFQLLLIVLGIIGIIYMSQQKEKELTTLKKNIEFTETNNKALLNFMNDVSYFNLYNPPIYDDFMTKMKEYIKLLKFVDIHAKNKYRLYPKKILKENLDFQKKDILETFASFEHTLDDTITSAYKLRDLTAQLDKILTKSNLII